MKLRGFERRWLEAIFGTILPDGDPSGLPGAAQVEWKPFLDDFASAAPARMLLGLRAALWFTVLLAPLLMLWRVRTFARLGGAERLRVLRALRESRFYLVRELPVLLKSVACLGYCRLPAVQRKVGLR